LNFSKLHIQGTLDVRVRGNSIPSSIFGRFSILCAILRQIILILKISIWTEELKELKPDYFFVDQLSAGVILLRIFWPRVKILFYCHFPDKLLAKKGGTLKTLYRWPFDWLESYSTGLCDRILVNSKFTKSVFGQAFPRLKDRRPAVVYPCVDIALAERQKEDVSKDDQAPLWVDKKVLLSINRYEKKKDVGLAVKAFARLSATERSSALLVIAGGYDPRNQENHITHTELQELADSLSLKHATHKTIPSALAIPKDIQVLFLHSVPNAFKYQLLATAKLLIYTPLHEHFGIVPLEAMLAETPVLAANEGGPTETVVDDETGWLRNVNDIDAWKDVMSIALRNDSDSIAKLAKMGEAGRKRVVDQFSKEKMADRLDEEIDLLSRSDRPSMTNANVVEMLAWMMLFLGFGTVIYIGVTAPQLPDGK
jgi:alpha-1,3/alpha-1,6-mannosyltransferase